MIPTSVNDTGTVTEDSPSNPITGNVLTNDIDLDGDTLRVTSFVTSGSSHGSVIITPNGSYTYTLDNTDPAVNALNTGETLVDSFSYTISDDHGGTSSATLSITIHGTTDNGLPTAADDSNAVKEDTAPNPITGNVLTNDSDPNGDVLSVTNTGTFVLDHGIVVMHADGSYTYTLDNSNPNVNALNDGQSFVDSFTYNVSDGHGGTNSANLDITINGSTDNRAPTAVNDNGTVTEDAAPNPVTGNVLANDSDPDGNAISVTNAGTFTLDHGILVMHADGSYSYTLDNSHPAVNALNDGQTLADSFTYNVGDGHGGTSSASLDITIQGTTDNRAPTAVNDSDTVKEDTAPNPITGDVLANDSDPDGNALFVITISTGPTHGVLSLDPNGSYTYTLDNTDPAVDALNDGQTLVDSFNYEITDGHGGTSWATLDITIQGTTDNRSPIAVDDGNTVTEDTALNSVSGNVLANDSDPDGNALSIEVIGSYTLDHGVLVLNIDGSYTYTLDNSDPAVNALNDGQTLVESFTYGVTDRHGGTSSATLDITIQGSTDNRSPIAADDGNTVKEDTVPNPVTGNVLANDSDPDGNALSVTNAGTFTLDHGVLVVNADGSYSYTLDNTDPAVNALNAGQTLADSFTYGVSDGHGGTSSATLAIAINGTSDTPSVPVLELASDSGISNSDHITNDHTPTVTGTAAAGSTVTLFDTDGTTKLATATADANGAYSFTAELSEGTHALTAKATDGAGNTSDPSAALQVTIDSTAPHLAGISASPGSGEIGAGSTVTFVLDFDEAADVSGGAPSLTLNNGGSALYDAAKTALLGDSSKLVFDYVVSGNEPPVPSLAITGLVAHGATVDDTAGNHANLANVTAAFDLMVNEHSVAAVTINGFTRPELHLDNSGAIILDDAAAAAAAAYGTKFLYLGLPEGTPYPPVHPPVSDFHLV